MNYLLATNYDFILRDFILYFVGTRANTWAKQTFNQLKKKENIEKSASEWKIWELWSYIVSRLITKLKGNCSGDDTQIENFIYQKT